MTTAMRWLLLAVTVVLAGCATLNENECRSVDWRELGRNDGAHGYESSRLGEHMEACGKYGITPDGGAYRAGRDEGLHQYCQPDNALQLGRSGGGYNQVCPGESGAMFVAFYNRGALVRQIESDLHQLQEEMDAQRHAQDGTKELSLYKELAQNLRYLEQQSSYLQMRLDRAQQDVADGRDPEFYSSQDWHGGMPFPDARKAAEHHDDHHGDDRNHH